MDWEAFFRVALGLLAALAAWAALGTAVLAARLRHPPALGLALHFLSLALLFGGVIAPWVGARQLPQLLLPTMIGLAIYRWRDGEARAQVMGFTLRAVLRWWELPGRGTERA